MTAIALAGVIAAVLVGALRSGVPARLLAWAPLGVVCFIYVANPANRVYSFHGFYHVPIVYGLMNGDIPPHDPFFAGHRLLYPWIYEGLAAATSWLARVTPPTSFAAINVVALVVAVWEILRIATLLGFNATAACMAVWLALLGITPLNVGPVSSLVERLLPFPMEFRGTPPLVVFTHPTGATLGIAFFLMALETAIRAARNEPMTERRTVGFLSFPLVAVGLVYPLQYLALAASVSLAAVGIWLQRHRFRRRALGMIGTVGVTTLLVLPYFLLIGWGKGPGAQLHLATSLNALLLGLQGYLTTILPLAALIMWQRSWLRESLRARRGALVVLLCFFIGASVMFMILDAPQGAQYKSRILASVALGILGAGALQTLYDRRPVTSFVVLWALFVPLGTDISFKVAGDWTVTDPWREKGFELVHADPEQQELHDWILRKTKPPDVFVDSYLTVPVFARRALYCAVDIRRRKIPGPRPRDGFGSPPARWLAEVCGYPTQKIAWRSSVVENIYSGRGGPLEERAVEALRAHARRVDLYVVARDASIQGKLSHDSRFEEVFANAAAVVFKLRKGSPVESA